MLQSLSVRNFALIDTLDVSFESGMSAITGETGSGKSILLGALALALGERADLQSLRDNSQKCVIEIRVRLEDRLRGFFESHDLDFDAESIIRREITPGGKSRSFINDTPVQLTITKALAREVVDIHSQHANSSLLQPAAQLSLLDDFAQSDGLLNAYRAAHAQWHELQAALREKEDALAALQRDADYMAFQWKELQALALDGLNEVELEADLKRYERAQEIREALGHGAMALLENGALDRVSEAVQALAQIEDVSAEFEGWRARLESVRIELQDIAADLERTQDGTEDDPQRTAELRETWNSLNQLLTKHQVATAQELLEKRNTLETALNRSKHGEEDLEALRQDLARAQADLQEAGERLREHRLKAIPPFLEELTSTLKELGLERATLTFDLRPREPAKDGMDDATLCFSANPGMTPKPVSKVASGGEISRLMLALKASAALRRRLPCLIFDEIDAGISGEIARRMGNVLYTLGQRAQILVITHQPSIAGRADAQFKVLKIQDDAQTFTALRQLDHDARVTEIAEMIAGQPISETARASAKTLLASE